MINFRPLKKKVMAEEKDEENQHRNDLHMLRYKYLSLQKEWDNQQEHLGRMQGEVFKLRNQLRTQSSFCASLGSTLGNLVWKASRLQPVVELFLTTNKLPELFSMTSGTLISFLETYSKDLPDLHSDETQFILSMGGIIANIAAVPEGRHYLVSDFSGKQLIEQILQLLPKIPLTTGDPLKRILLMILYNVSINAAGLLLLQDQKPLLETLTQIIMCDRTPELKLLSLRLYESLTYEFGSVAVFNIHRQCVPTKKLQTIMSDTDAEMRQYAQSIINNMKKAEETFVLAPIEPNIPYDQCILSKKICS